MGSALATDTIPVLVTMARKPKTGKISVSIVCRMDPYHFSQVDVHNAKAQATEFHSRNWFLVVVRCYGGHLGHVLLLQRWQWRCCDKGHWSFSNPFCGSWYNYGQILRGWSQHLTIQHIFFTTDLFTSLQHVSLQDEH